MAKLIGVIWFISHYWGPLAMADGVSSLGQCLAKEEERIHLNQVKGPIVKLNREMLSLFTTVKRPLLKKKYFHQICRSQSKFVPSLNLVRVILTHGKEAFYFTAQNPLKKKFQNNLLTHLSRRTGQLLLTYLSDIQGLSPRPDCLIERMRPLQKIYHKYKVLEEHEDTDQLMGPSDITQVFAQLNQLDKMMKACRPTSPSENSAPSLK